MTGLNEMIQASIMHKFPISPQQLANRYLQSNHTGNTDIEINKYRNSNLRHFITSLPPYDGSQEFLGNCGCHHSDPDLRETSHQHCHCQVHGDVP